MNACIIRSSTASNSISHDALMQSLNTDFLIHSINETYFQVNDVSILETDFDVIIVISDMNFIQSIPYSPKYVIIVDDIELSDEFDLSWHRFQTHRVISFSRSIHEKIQSSGLRCAYFQYYPQPETDEIKWTGRDDIMKLTVIGDGHKYMTSPLSKVPCYLDILNSGKFQLDEREIFLSDLNREIEDHDIFMISEFSYENLLAILSVMARGKIVITRDFPCVADYVGHLSSGIIDDGSQFQYHPSLGTKLLRTIGRGALQRSRVGHRRWLADRTRLLSLIMNDGQRWSGSDRSASFGNQIRRTASNAAHETASPE